MSKAKKCDRCGTYFDPKTIGEQECCWFGPPTLQTEKDYKNNTFRGSSPLNQLPMIDLCPKCTEDYKLFMEGCPLAVHENDFDQPDQEEEEDKPEETVEETQGTDEALADEINRSFEEMRAYIKKRLEIFRK